MTAPPRGPGTMQQPPTGPGAAGVQFHNVAPRSRPGLLLPLYCFSVLDDNTRLLCFRELDRAAAIGASNGKHVLE
jgi:hypothetical protein